MGEHCSGYCLPLGRFLLVVAACHPRLQAAHGHETEGPKLDGILAFVPSALSAHGWLDLESHAFASVRILHLVVRVFKQ